MREIKHPLGVVRVVEREEDTPGVSDLVFGNRPIAIDSETTGKFTYAPDFRVRLFQVGTADTAYVWRPQQFPALTEMCVTARPFYAHNASFDLLGLERELGIPFADMSRFAIDTGILSRLHDSRGRKEGGTGHALEELSEHFLKTASKSQALKELIAAAKKYDKSATKDTVWKIIPDTDETYLRYAGQDVLVTSRLGALLADLIDADGLGWLASFEHRVAYDCANMQRRGIAVDLPWIEAGRARYAEAYEAAEAALRDDFGVVKGKGAKSYNGAAASLTERLTATGAKLYRTTKSGALSLDDGALSEVAALGGESAALARTVLDARQAHKFGETYLGGFVNALGHDGRIHPKINPLAAVTGRMSVTDPPLQQMPRGDKTLRGSFVPDEGHVFISADYEQVEWRVAAGVTKDPNLLRVIREGGDIHGITAAAVFGEDFTGDQRTQGKPLGLGVLYGLGEPGMAEALAKIGLPASDAKRVRDGILKAYPGIGNFMSRAKAHLKGKGLTEFRTQIGRKFLTDRGHLVLNYYCQGQARDLFAEAVVKMTDAGLGDSLRLLVHDEVVLSVPREEAETACRIVDECMNTEFLGVPITAQAEIMGDRWRKMG